MVATKIKSSFAVL